MYNYHMSLEMCKKNWESFNWRLFFQKKAVTHQTVVFKHLASIYCHQQLASHLTISWTRGCFSSLILHFGFLFESIFHSTVFVAIGKLTTDLVILWWQARIILGIWIFFLCGVLLHPIHVVCITCSLVKEDTSFHQGASSVFLLYRCMPTGVSVCVCVCVLLRPFLHWHTAASCFLPSFFSTKQVERTKFVIA